VIVVAAGGRFPHLLVLGPGEADDQQRHQDHHHHGKEGDLDLSGARRGGK
jgi:hypothetical protein